MNYLVTDTELTNVADAIRARGRTEDLLEWPNGFINAVRNIEKSALRVSVETIYTFPYDDISYSGIAFVEE